MEIAALVSALIDSRGSREAVAGLTGLVQGVYN
jgi:hypothetical protein